MVEAEHTANILMIHHKWGLGKKLTVIPVGFIY